jgi:hypothetical protein
MEEDFNSADTGREDLQETRAGLPPSGSGAHTTGATTVRTAKEVATATTSSSCIAPTGAASPTGATRLRLGTPNPPKIPIRAGGGTSPDNRNSVEHQNKFAPLR